MKRYTDREHTPLKFHKFFKYILLPLWIIFGAFNTVAAVLMVFNAFLDLFDSMAALGHFLLQLLSFFVTLIGTILSLKAMDGLRAWKKSGIKAVYQLLILGCATEFFFFPFLDENILSLIFTFLLDGLIYIYYRKREGLFTEDGSLPPVSEPAPTDAPAYTFDPVEEPAPEAEPALAEEPAPEAEPAPVEEPAPEAEPAPPMRFSRPCGARLVEGARFCTACGKPLEE